MNPGRSQRFPLLPGLLIAAVCCLGLALRLLFLDSDAYPRLSWSSALLTDEGYYIHNARNLVLFGTERTDEFNNRLLMPVLHAIQVLVFSLLGVGAIQARLISVVMSLIALVLFFDALRRPFGLRVAWLGALFLGLDHTYLLYNRMALMDTPATLFLIGAFWVFVKSQETAPASSAHESLSARNGIRRAGTWALPLCGALLLLAYATRGLSAIVILAPILALWRTKTDYRTFCCAVFPLVLGLCASVTLYLLLWYLPHHMEMGRLSRYYIANQLLPHSLFQFAQNLYLNTLGDARGMASFLFRHTPVLFVASCLWLTGWGRLGRNWGENNEKQESPTISIYENASVCYLMWWLLLCWLFFSSVNYNPSRYYVLFLPAMAGLAALSIVRVSESGKIPRKVHWSNMLLAVFLCYHFLSALLPMFAVWSPGWLFVVCGSISLIVVLLFSDRLLHIASTWKREYLSLLTGAAVFVWAGINVFWLTDWLSGLSYRQRDADRWLAQNLPQESVLMGDVAPGLCLDNRFLAVSVIPGLCNDDHPVQRFAGHPRYILILDENRWKEQWWSANYPELMDVNRRIHAFRGLLRSQFVIGVYEVPRDFVAAE